MRKNLKKICLVAACLTVAISAISLKTALANDCTYYCDYNPDYDCTLRYTDGSSTYCPRGYPNGNVHVPIIHEENPN